MSWHLLINSLLLNAGVAVCSAIIGFTASLWLITASRLQRRFFLCGVIAVLALPPFLMTNALLELLQDAGTARTWFTSTWLRIIPGEPALPTGPLPALVVLTSMYWPITTLALWAAWSRIDPALVEADPMLERASFVRHLLLPLGRNALMFAAVLTFALALNNFSVASVLQAKTYPVEIWIRFNTGLDWKGTLAASWPMVLAQMLAAAYLAGKTIPWPARRTPSLETMLTSRLGGWKWAGLLVATLGIVISLFFPLAHLVTSPDTWTALPAAVLASQSSLWDSLFYAGTAAATCLVLGVVLADSRHARNFASLFWVLFFIPGTVLGILAAQSFTNQWLEWLRNSALPVVFVLVLKYLALAWASARVSIDSCDRTLVDVASLEGATLRQRLIYLYAPQSGKQILAGSYAIFLLALWEVESVLPVVPPGRDPLAMRVFNLLHYGHAPEINALCLLLTLIAVAPLMAYWLARLLHKRLAPYTRALCVIGPLVLVTGCAEGKNGHNGEFKSNIFSRAEVIGAKGAGLGQFTKPRSLAVDAQDNLYVADMTGRVQKFSPSGQFLLSWQMPQTDLGRPKGMCRDQQGNIVVIEPHYSRINHFDPSGSLVFQWGHHGTNRGDMAFPRAAAADSTGRIYVSEYGMFERVQRFAMSKEGTRLQVAFEAQFGSPGNKPGLFNRPEGIALDEQGHVFVADSCNHRVQVFDTNGRYLTLFGKAGDGSGELSYPYDVAVDRTGLRFVCEFGNSRIQVFGTNNASIEIIGGPGSAPGRFANPWSVAIDSAGNLYVADSRNHRVQKLVRKS